MIPITRVELPEAAEGYVLDVLRSGRLAQGPWIERFEQAFADRHQVAHAVAVSNGTVSLQLAAAALGIGPGDEVVTSPFTFVATVNAMLAVGATVRFADIDPATYAVDADALDAAITPATAAVVPVHLYGQPADVARIAEVAARHEVAVIEDAAQAPGAAFAGVPVGGAGVGSFSFYATKNLTTGEGGMVTTNDDAIADRLRLLRNQGMRERYRYEVVAGNHRMTELQAAVGVAELEVLDERTARRAANAAALSARLDGLPGLQVPVVAPDRTHVFHQYTVRVGADAPLTRDELATALDAAGVGSGVYYPDAIPAIACYAEHPNVVVGSFPEAERTAREVLSLPVHPHLRADELEAVADAVHRAWEAAR